MAKEVEKNSKLSYKVKKINTSKFSFVEIEEKDLGNLFLKDDVLNIELDVGMGINKEKSEIFFEISTSLKNKDSNEIIVQHTGKTIFQMNHLEETYNKEHDQFDLPDGLVVQLYALSYSHARALLAVELNNTIYKDKFYLPVIDPTKIIKK